MAQPFKFNITGILKKAYGQEPTNITPLSGYDDTNYVVTCKSKIETGETENLILKIINEVDSAKEGLTVAILTVLKNLPSLSFKIPRPHVCINRELIWRLETATGGIRNVSLLSYVTGLCYDEVQFNPDSLPKLYRNIGFCAGELASELIKVDSNLLPALQRVGEEYNIENIHLSRRKLELVEDLNVRSVCSNAMFIFENFSLKNSCIKNSLRKSIIHNDMCLENFIFHKNTKTEAGYSVAGIIDFSDMSISYCVFEAAILVASAMYTAHFVVGSDIFIVGKNALLGFEQNFSLTKPEKEFLYNAVLGRFVSLRVLGGYDVSISKQTAEHEMHDTCALDYFITMLSSYGEKKWNEDMGIE